MSIFYAAVHEKNSWRSHTQHATLEAAISGRDGAENLLLLRGRSAKLVAVHGKVHAVFVWEDGQLDAMALRIKPDKEGDIERVCVPVAELESFKNKVGPSREQIAQWFLSAQPHGVQNLEPGIPLPIFASKASPLVEQPTLRSYRYGSKPTRDIVYEAILAHGRPVSVGELGELVTADIQEFKLSNLAADLSMQSVNCFSRGNYAPNRAPRRTDTGNPYDKLIRLGNRRNVRFAPYDPQIHGVWELIDVGDKVLRPRYIDVADVVELKQVRDIVEAAGLFDPAEDARQRTLAEIVRRDGQPAFRRSLLAAYGGSCAISGCSVEALLEAAHIVPYRGVQTNIVGNGLLLRSDLHKLFDLHLLAIDPITRAVHLSEVLRHSEYKTLHGVTLRSPADPAQAPLTEMLAYHQERCGWIHAGQNDDSLDQ